MFILPRGSQKPGSVTEVDWDHPFSDGLLMCIPFDEGVWDTSSATLKYQPRTIWGATAPRVPGNGAGTVNWASNTDGRAIHCTDGTSRIGTWADFIPLSGVTIAVIRRKLVAAVPGGTGGALFLDGTASGGERVGMFCPYIDQNAYFSFGGVSAPNTLIVNTIPLTTSVDRWIMTAGKNGLHAWRNGVKIGSSATAITRSTTSGSLSLNGGANAGDNQEINFLWIVDHPWPNEICQWWSAEPYAALCPSQTKRYAFLAGGLEVGPTIAVSTGALVITGRAPLLAQSKNLSPSVGTLALVGRTPTLTRAFALSPGADALVLTGRAPLVEVEAPQLDTPDVIGPTGSILDIISDMHMQCPPNYYGGYKDGRIERAGYGERSLSDLVTGDPTSSTFSYRRSDYDGKLRRYLASTDKRYWTVDPVTAHMTTRANRAQLGRAYPVFVGPIIDAQPSRPMSWDITLGDIISQRVLTDRAVHPSRKIGDGFIHDTGTTALGVRSALSSVLDFDTPEPEIYGQHRRVRNYGEAEPGDPPSEHGFEVDLTNHYLGIWDLGGGDKHVWLVAGHACADFPDVNTVAADGTHNTVIPDEGTAWWIPHYAGWLALFGAPYVDLRSTSFGNLRRYSLILGAVGSAEPDACAFASGGYPMDPGPPVELKLMAFVDGIEPAGDGSGDALIEFAQCHKDWWNNYGSRSAADSYQSGPRLGSPTWTLSNPDGTTYSVQVVDEQSFDDVSAINQIRFPALNGYRCAAIIGAKAGDIHPMNKWRADWNRSGFVCDAWNHKGQIGIFTPHPTAAAKAAARLVTDAYEMRQGSFNTEIRWTDQANRIPVQGDLDHATGRLMTSVIVDAGDAITNYDREILGDTRVLPFLPGIALLTHVGFLHAWLFKHPPRHVVFEDTVGPDYLGDSLGYLKCGEYVRYTHYAQVGEPKQERLGWALRARVNAGGRRAEARVWDMEEHIDFDIPTVVEDVLNETCETAIVVTNGADEAYAINLDTSLHATDPDVAGIAGLPGPAIGYHAAHIAYTPAVNGTLFLTTVHSLYDTQLAVCTGACGSLVFEQYNDNDGILQTSILEFAVTGGVPLHIIVYGYGPDDGGALTFGLLFTAA